ncbi:hypothetical protein SAMN04487894_12143, partial [Niabella drilacis]
HFIVRTRLRMEPRVQAVTRKAQLHQADFNLTHLRSFGKGAKKWE